MGKSPLEPGNFMPIKRSHQNLRPQTLAYGAPEISHRKIKFSSYHSMKIIGFAIYLFELIKLHSIGG